LVLVGWTQNTKALAQFDKMNSNFSRRVLGKTLLFFQQIRNATKKAGGSTKNGRDSPGQRLGVKKFGGYKNSK